MYACFANHKLITEDIKISMPVKVIYEILSKLAGYKNWKKYTEEGVLEMVELMTISENIEDLESVIDLNSENTFIHLENLVVFGYTDTYENLFIVVWTPEDTVNIYFSLATKESIYKIIQATTKRYPVDDGVECKIEVVD
jgi:hypothetical protein